MPDDPEPINIETQPVPDDRPQRRREYSGAGSTLGVAALLILAVGLAIWWFELRGGGGNGSGLDDGYGVIALEQAQNATGKSAVAETGRAAPNFRLANLDDSGVALTDHRGKFVLVNFWASWCGPCRGEVPDLEALSERQRERLVVLGVNQQESREAAAKFTEEFAIAYPVLLDRSGEVSQAYRLGGLPVTFLVNPEGVILRIYRGRITGEQIEELEQEYLGQ